LGVDVIGQVDGDVGEALGGVGFGCAEEGPGVAVGDHAEAAVFFVAVVESEPGGDASAGLDAQVLLVLVEGLAAGAGRLEVEHGLHGEGFAAEHVGNTSIQAAVQHPVPAEFIPTVHVDHAGVFLERVVAVVVDTGGVAGVGAGGSKVHEVLAEAPDLGLRKEAGDIEEALVIELGLLFCCQHVYCSRGAVKDKEYGIGKRLFRYVWVLVLGLRCRTGHYIGKTVVEVGVAANSTDFSGLCKVCRKAGGIPGIGCS